MPEMPKHGRGRPCKNESSSDGPAKPQAPCEIPQQGSKRGISDVDKDQHPATKTQKVHTALHSVTLPQHLFTLSNQCSAVTSTRLYIT